MAARQPLIELVEPLGDDSPVSRSAARGGGLHHVCYEVADIEERLAAGRTEGGAVISGRQPAVAFGDRPIGWLLTRERLLVEFLEATNPAPSG